MVIKDDGNEPLQSQTGAGTDHGGDQWESQPPYRVHSPDETFEVKWQGQCHCGRVQYQLSRDGPLASKYCHCTTCQKLHASPFQWAAIFHKTDINFTHGHNGLVWYDAGSRLARHHLPCKVSCGYCRTHIMDEGRNMILLFPTLIEGINTPKGREAFRPQCHMFYSQRVVDFHGDGAEKWSGMQGKSTLLDDDGTEIARDGHNGDGDEAKEK